MSVIGGTSPASFTQTYYENLDFRVLKIVPDAIPGSVFEDLIESTQASTLRFNALAAPYR